ncbi:VC2046/SO_2500 family protein [Alteromonas sp. a30]|uniref:VC2046/SO_2500 family protein n=1 Tax=Alteromonas sp. a30 TaxID=2730917 RepID=UPI00227F5EF3|nr:VC2046/SO_2500 family protein [Alteromonas sp. a30]MCY7294141.1 hypothetical protein [Alteromonas sp. a30]
MSDNQVQALIESEFKGALSRTLSQQGKQDFALLLAMLQQDITNKLRLTDTQPVAVKDTRERELAFIENAYPETPLSAEDIHWKQQAKVTQAMANADFANVRLLQQMYPPPLALQNDPAFIAEEVVANCDVFCQQRMIENKSHEKEVDPTLIYDVIGKAKGEQTQSFEPAA